MKQILLVCALLLCGVLFAANPVIPEVIYAAPGAECNVYFSSLALNGFPGEIEVFCKVGRQDVKRWRFTPKAEDAGKSFPLTIQWKDPDGKTLAECKSVVKVAPLVKEKKTITVLLSGSSSTDGTYFPKQLRKRLEADGYTVKFIGSHIGGGRPAAKPDDILLEGRGGWTYRSFVTQWTAKTDYRGKSPFLTGPGKFDFQAYLNKYNNGKAPDFITVYLGGNDIAGANDQTIRKHLDSVSKYFDLLIKGFRAAAPDARIGIALSAAPAGQDAFGNNYGTKLRRPQYCRNLQKLWGLLIEKCKAYPHVTPVPVSVGLDTEHHYPSRMEPVAEGSSIKVLRQSNALHPNLDGNKQIGDIFYFWMRNQMP